MEVPLALRALRAPRARLLDDRSLSEPELHRRRSQIMMPEPMGKYNAMRKPDCDRSPVSEIRESSRVRLVVAE